MAAPLRGQQSNKAQGINFQFPWRSLFIVFVIIVIAVGSTLFGFLVGLGAAVMYAFLVGLGLLLVWHQIIPTLPHSGESHVSPPPGKIPPDPKPQPQPAPSARTLPFFLNVPRRNPIFTGREEVLKQLYDTLGEHKVAVLTQSHEISSLGGIGKTETAKEYAYQHRNDYRDILWVQADSLEILYESLRTMTERLIKKDIQGPVNNVIVFRHWLEDNTDWLLVLDNTYSLEIVNRIVPPESKGHTLLTTCEQATVPIPQVVVGNMKPEEGAFLLLRRANLIKQGESVDKASSDERTNAEKINEVLGGHPLALDQAGAYVAETGRGLSGYLELYAMERDTLLKRRGRLPLGHPESVATTLLLLIEKVEQTNTTAVELIRFCSSFPSDTIPEKIISKGLTIQGQELDNALEKLLKFSLVRRDLKNETVVIHRLVQIVLQDNMTKAEQRLWMKRSMLAITSTFSYAEAEKYYADALVQNERILEYDPSHKVVCLNNLNNLANLHCIQGQYTLAEQELKRALDICKQTQEQKQSNIVLCLNNLAKLYIIQEKYEEALSLCEQARKICIQKGRDNHPDMASYLNNLAEIYYVRSKCHKYEKLYGDVTERLYKWALAIREQSLGPADPDVATSKNGLAELYFAQGKYDQAENLYKKALDIREQSLVLQ